MQSSSIRFPSRLLTDITWRQVYSPASQCTHSPLCGSASPVGSAALAHDRQPPCKNDNDDQMWTPHSDSQRGRGDEPSFIKDRVEGVCMTWKKAGFQVKPFSPLHTKPDRFVNCVTSRKSSDAALPILMLEACQRRKGGGNQSFFATQFHLERSSVLKSTRNFTETRNSKPNYRHSDHLEPFWQTRLDQLDGHNATGVSMWAMFLFWERLNRREQK